MFAGFGRLLKVDVQRGTFVKSMPALRAAGAGGVGECQAVLWVRRERAEGCHEKLT